MKKTFVIAMAATLCTAIMGCQKESTDDSSRNNPSGKDIVIEEPDTDWTYLEYDEADAQQGKVWRAMDTTIQWEEWQDSSVTHRRQVVRGYEVVVTVLDSDRIHVATQLRHCNEEETYLRPFFMADTFGYDFHPEEDSTLYLYPFDSEGNRMQEATFPVKLVFLSEDAVRFVNELCFAEDVPEYLFVRVAF